MATVIKDLGAVTAYAYAVEGGYTGTEEEFAALLGNIADDLSQIENLSVTVTTLPAGSSATASYSNGVLALGIPKGDKGDKGDTGATPAFTIGTVTTLAAGNDASASITGTAAAPVLNLGIPKGADGDVSSASMATAYSTSATYAVGDYVWYSGQLYCCTTAISTAESWTAAHWAAVKLAEDVGNLKSALPSFAPNSTIVAYGAPEYASEQNGRAWYRSGSNAVASTPASGVFSVCVALSDISDSIIIDYAGFSGSGSQNALIMAEGAELGSTIDHYWGAKPSSNFDGYGSIDGNLVTVKKSLVAQTSPNTTHLFINISAASGSIKNVLWSGSESVIETANKAQETANKAQSEIDFFTKWERITPTVVSSEYRLVTNGSCVNDSNYKMLKYAVTAGEKVYIKAALDGVISAQFQTVANVPYTTNPNIVGDPIREAVDGVFTVPENATYVIINAYASNDVSGLYSVKVVNQDSPEASLPTYWQTYLNSKATDIDAAIDSVGNHGDYFSFFTDYHINSNQQHTSLILKTIREAHRIDFDVFGGDALTNHTKANALQFLNKFESDFEHNGFFPLVGNHEKNPYNNAEDVLTDDDIYPILFKRLEKNPKVSLRPRMYYRIDNETQSIRYLFLNTDTVSNGSDWYLDSAQIQWLEDELNSAPEGWYVVIFTHMFYSNSTGTEIDGIGTLLKRICNAFQSRTTYTSTSASHTFDFTNAKGKMCAIITGHVHADYADTSNAYPIIATICDTNQAQQQPSGSTVDRTTGTINEQAIDLFFIDTAAKTIDTIRIGAGSDRSFTFE